MLLITLILPETSLDLEVSADVPLARVFPILLTACCALTGVETMNAATGLILADEDAAPLLMTRSLETQGIVDGQRLRLLMSDSVRKATVPITAI